MKNLTDEIKLTIEMMQGDIDDGAHGELQTHLYSLLEIKRNELQQKLKESSWLFDIAMQPEAPCKSVRIECGDKRPLTDEDSEKVLNDIYSIIASVERKGNRSDMAEALYDAGYRKTGDYK